jgi:hypothetical protein
MKIRDPMMIKITDDKPKRLYYFDSKKILTTICKDNQFIPNLLTGECITRVILNLRNLLVSRGYENDEESMMTGPHFYYGFISPYSVYQIKNNIFYEINEFDNIQNSNINKLKISNKYIIKIQNFVWRSHSLPDSDNSLFNFPGELVIKDKKRLRFNLIDDPIHYDFSDFKVQIVKNDQSFQFSRENLEKYPDSRVKLRVINYRFGKNYTKYLDQTDGIFIEKHEFIQSITPIDKYCDGFIILGREKNDNIELITVKINYGYTILIESYAIHGDSNLIGDYMMTMTGDHNIMNKSNTVFLRRDDGGNIRVEGV